MSEIQIKKRKVNFFVLKYREHKLPFNLFGVYLLSILIFSIVYYELYDSNTHNFTFHNEIREIRKQMNDDEFRNLLINKNQAKERLVKGINMLKPIMEIAESSKTERSSDSLKILFPDGYYMLTCRYPPRTFVTSVKDPPDSIFYLTIKSSRNITKIDIPDLILPPPTVTVVIPAKSAGSSGSNRPPVPTENGRWFRSKSAT